MSANQNNNEGNTAGASELYDPEQILYRQDALEQCQAAIWNNFIANFVATCIECAIFESSLRQSSRPSF
jgi:hypothetical protein